VSPRRSRLGGMLACLALAGWLVPVAARAADAPIAAPAADSALDAGAAPERGADGLDHLVPELANHPYALEPGVRPYLHRVAISPGFGRLGSERLFVLRAAYNPNDWLGYEAVIGHNPSHAVQAIVHQFSAIVRRPLAGRFQPYLSAGYGMTIVLPGKSINADPVTKNEFTFGGGVEYYLRGDLALRAEMLGMTVIGRQQNRTGLVAYDYGEQTIALAFYRSIRP